MTALEREAVVMRMAVVDDLRSLVVLGNVGFRSSIDCSTVVARCKSSENRSDAR